jgi:hypothetical protein
MNRDSLIVELTNAGVIGKGLKSSKNAEKRMSATLVNQLTLETSYLDENVTLYERLLNIRLGITEEPKCENCSMGLSGRIYWSQRKYHSFCSSICRHQHTTLKRTNALTNNNSELAKSISKKSLETQKKRGTLAERITKSLITKRANGQCVPENLIPAYQAYRSKVHSITKKQPLHLLENIEKRGPVNDGGWHVDHEYSIHQGFIDATPAEITGHFCNLRVIPGKLNISKQEKCSITLSELLIRIENHQNLQLQFQAKTFGHRPAGH